MEQWLREYVKSRQFSDISVLQKSWEASPLQQLLELLASIRSDTQETAVIIAADEGHTEILRLLLTLPKGIADDLLEETAKNEETALHKAAKRKDPELVMLLLDSVSPFMMFPLVAEPNWFGQTALTLAAANGNAESVEALLQNFSSNKRLLLIQMQDKDGSTALHWAASYGHTDVIDRILTAVPSTSVSNLLHIKNRNNETPLDLAKLSKTTETTPLLLRWQNQPEVEGLSKSLEKRMALHGKKEEQLCAQEREHTVQREQFDVQGRLLDILERLNSCIWRIFKSTSDLPQELGSKEKLYDMQESWFAELTINRHWLNRLVESLEGLIDEMAALPKQQEAQSERKSEEDKKLRSKTRLYDAQGRQRTKVFVSLNRLIDTLEELHVRKAYLPKPQEARSERKSEEDDSKLLEEPRSKEWHNDAQEKQLDRLTKLGGEIGGEIGRIATLLKQQEAQSERKSEEDKTEPLEVCPDSEDPLPSPSMTSEPHHSQADSEAETSLQKDTTALEDSSDGEEEVQRKKDNKLFLELGREIKALLTERELKEFSIFQNPYARTNVYVIGKDASSILGERLESFLKTTSRFDKFCVTLHEREGTITSSQLAGDHSWSEVLTLSCQADAANSDKNHATSEVLVQQTAPPKSIYAVGPAHMLFTKSENESYYSKECDIDEVRTRAQERSVDVRWRGRERDAEVTRLLGYRYAFRQMPESVHGKFTNDCVLLKLNDQQIAESMQEDLHTSIDFRTETLKTISSFEELQELQENEARISVRRYKGRLYNCGAGENEMSLANKRTVHLSFYLDNASVKLIPGHSGSIVYYVEEGKRSPLGMLIERERISADNSRFHYYKAVVLNQAFRDIEADNLAIGKIELYAGPVQLPPSEKACPRNNFRHQ